MNKNEHTATMYETIPAIAELNKVPGFNPLRLLRRAISPENGETVLQLDLPYKKLWFRLANPKGRIKLNALHITEQLAIFEAQVYLDLSDENPIGSFTASCMKENAPRGQYIQAAQQAAMNEALSDAGFGIQFADVNMGESGSLYGSQIPLNALPKAKETNQTPKTAGSVVKPFPITVQKTADIHPQTTAPEKEPAPDISEELPFPGKACPETDTQKAVQGMMALLDGQTPSTETPTPADETAHKAAEPEVQTLPVTSGQEPETSVPRYTADMPIEEIVKLMTFEEARNVVVDTGVCKGQTLAEVAERRPPSLKFYLYGGYKGDNNILRAAAQIMLDSLADRKAG